jgi:hypothetical protein
MKDGAQPEPTKGNVIVENRSPVLCGRKGILFL